MAWWVLYRDGRIIREPNKSKGNHGVVERDSNTDEGLARLQQLRKTHNDFAAKHKG